MRSDILVPNPQARHPIRRMIRPPASAAEPAKVNDDQDLKLFALSFTAFFICIYTLIF